jgi:hypothetical protein
MIEKRGKSQMNRGLVFLLVLLVIVGLFLVYTKLTFTGYVTNVVYAPNGSTMSSNDFSLGSDSNTQSSGGVVALPLNKITGTYTSQVFNAGQNAFWINFVPIYDLLNTNSSNNSVVFSVRTCDDNVCATGNNFSVFNGNLNLIGRYFQYKVELSRLLASDSSPVISQVDVSYYLPVALPIAIDSPQSIIYNNESVPVRISTSNPTAALTFSIDGANTETYAGEVNKVLSQGQHTLTAGVSYTDGNITYQNSTSVTFTVEFLQTFYRLANNACSAVTVVPSQKTANDYNSLAECQSHITATNTTNNNQQNNDQTQQTCSSSWKCADWSTCAGDVQTRSCEDVSNCSVSTDFPPTSQACITEATQQTEVLTNTPPTTTQTTQTTAKRGFFSIVGSVITAPIKSVAGTVISVLVLVLVAGGFIAFKVSKKKNLGLFFNDILGKIKKNKFQ